MSPRSYRLFGLSIASELALPELPETEAAGAPDVVIVHREIAVAGQSPGVIALDEGVLLTIEDVARYWVRDGSRIDVEPVADCDPRNVRLFLLGSAFGMLLHQRGLLPLHANAIEINGKAVAFMGESGAGKSTLAAWFHDRGFPILADDVCVVSPSSDGATVSPGLPRLRLWLEALEQSGRDQRGLQRSYAGDTPYEKFDVPLDLISGSETRLAAVYLLERGAKSHIDRLFGSAAAEAIFANTYRGAFVGAAQRHAMHWSACINLLQTTPIFEARRLWGFDQFETEAEQILEHAKSVIGTPQSP